MERDGTGARARAHNGCCHRLVAFGKLAEFAGQYLQKGRAIFAEGRLRTNKWEDSAGQKHSRTEVVLSELQFVGQKPKEAAAA